MAERITTAAATSRGPKRNAAHTRGGRQRNARGYDTSAGSKQISSPEAITDTNNNAASRSRFGFQESTRLSCHNTRSGVLKIAPAASPSHHVNQMAGKLRHSA